MDAPFPRPAGEALSVAERLGAGALMPNSPLMVAEPPHDVPSQRADGLLDRICRPRIAMPVLLALATAVSAWYADARLPNPDEGAVLTAAAKILRGAVFYRDIDAYPFPGAYYLGALAMGIFGEHLSVARWLAAALFLGVVASLYRASLHLLTPRRAALFGLSLLSFKFLAWPGFSAYLYSDVAFCATCAAIALLMGHRFRGASLRLVLAGVCVGIALLSKQNLGIYLGAAIASALLVPEWLLGTARAEPRWRWTEVGAWAFGVAAAVLPSLVYFASHGLLGKMLTSGLIRPFTGYLPTSGIPFSTPLAWWRFGELQHNAASPYFPLDYWHMLMEGELPGSEWYPVFWLAGELFSRLVYTSIPVAFAWVLVKRLRSRSGGDDRSTGRFLFAWLALATAAAALPRADWFHVMSVYPVVLLLLFALLQPGPTAGDGAPRTAAWLRLEAVAVALLLLATGILALHHRSTLTYRVALDRAEVDVEPADAWIEPLVEYVRAHVGESEPLFVYGHEAQLYFLTARFYPWRFSQLYPGQDGGAEGRRLAAQLRRYPPKLVLRGLLAWPGIPSLMEYAPALFEYVFRFFVPDPAFFAEHPIRGGAEPPHWVIEVMRPAKGPDDAE